MRRFGRTSSVCLLLIIGIKVLQTLIFSRNTLNTYNTVSQYAIVIPFTSWESEVLLRNFEFWNIFTPCTLDSSRIDLIFYFHKDLTKGSGHLINMFRSSINKNDNVSRCFNSIKFLNAGLSESQDLYPESASRMFFNLFKFPRMTIYTSFFYMEADVLPCKSGWIDALLKEFKVHGGFWVRGSIIRGSDAVTGQYSYSNHINGNALYSIGNPSFRSFILDVVEPNFWKNPNDYLGGYDVGLHMIRLDRSIVSWDYYTETVHLFQYTNFIQNYYRKPTNATLICKSFPETFLVHGRNVLY